MDHCSQPAVLSWLPPFPTCHSPELCGPFIYILLQLPCLSGLSLAGHFTEMEFSSGPFPTTTPVLHWRTRRSITLIFTPIQVCRTQHLHRPPSSPLRNLVLFLFKSYLPFLNCELVAVRKWVFTTLVRSSDPVFQKVLSLARQLRT